MAGAVKQIAAGIASCGCQFLRHSTVVPAQFPLFPVQARTFRTWSTWAAILRDWQHRVGPIAVSSAPHHFTRANMDLPIPLEDDMFAERNHWSHTKPQSSPTPDGGIGFGKGLLENYSSQHSRTLNNCTGGSSSHGDGPRGDELGGSEISDEVFSISGEKTTTQQGELDLIPADFGTLDDRQELQGEDKPADDFSELPALDQALSSSGNREDGTNVTKKSTPDKSYVPSSGYGSPRLTGKRKLARSMRGLSPINTRSRTRLGYIGDKNSSPTNPTQAEQARESGTESSRKKKPAASHKRVAKKPFGSGKNGPGSDVLRNQPATKLGASQVRGSKPESPDNVSSASSNRRQYTDCKDAASSATSGKAPDMSIYDVEGSPEPEKPAPRKTAAKGRSKKRAAPAPTTSSQVQPAKEVSNQKFQAPAGSKSQAKIQENRKPKPFQTYGRAVAEDVIDESSPEWTTIPNSKRRRSHTGQETTDRPLKKVKAEDGTKALPGQDEQASSASGKVHIVSSDDGDDGGGVAECEGVFNAGLNPDLPRTQCRVVNPVELGISPQGEFTQRITTHGAIQWASAKGRRPSKLAVTSGQEQNDVARSTADLGDMRAPLPLQVVSHLPTSRPHSSITKGTSTKPMSTASKSERVPCIGLDRSNRIAPLFSGQNEQYLGALHPNTAGQQDDHQSSPYSLHPRSMAFHQKLSSMQDARENGFSGSKDTDIAQPQAARGQNSSRTEAHDDPLEEKNRWQAAVDETSQGLADTMHAITGAVLRELTSKEASIDSIVKEYSHNGAMIAANSFQRQQEERERAVARFEVICTNLSHEFSRANEQNTQMQTELSSKMRRLRQLVTKRQRDHRKIMVVDSAKPENQGVI